MDGAHSDIPVQGEPVYDWWHTVYDWWQRVMDLLLRERRVSARQNSDVPPISSHARNEIRSIHDVRTLKDCLIFFSFPTILSELDGSLERVRKHQESKEVHKDYWKEIDRKLQRMSFQYHPDRVSNRGGTPDELLEAQKAQTALNTTRTVLNVLNEDFLGDLDIDHKYKFYEKLELNSLGNEEEIKRHIKHVLHKTVWLSEIKQVHIIAQIRMFLSEGRLSLQSYIQGDRSQFKMHRGYALYHLSKCIDGYDKLLIEFKIICEECRKENLDNIGSLIKEMESKSIKESQTLKSLMNVAKISLAGQFKVFNQWTKVDDYLVLPFAYYVNAMLMCSLMQSKKHKNPFNILSYISTYDKYVPLGGMNNLETLFNASTMLAYKLYEEYHTKPSNIINEKITEEEIKIIFDKCMKKIKEELENRFKTESYNEGGNKNFISRQCSNFMNVAKDIDEKVTNLVKDMQKSKTMNEEIQKKYDHAMKFSCGFEKNNEESSEQSKVLLEEDSKDFLKGHSEPRKEEVSYVNGSDDMERIVAECLELHEEVSKVLNRRSQNTVENGPNCEGITHKFVSEVIESKNQSDLPHEQVSFATQKEKNETELENIYIVDEKVDIRRNVQNELMSLNVSEESRTTDQSLVDRKTNSNEVSHSMLLSEENPLYKQQNTNFNVESTEVKTKTNEFRDENNCGQCEFHTEHLISEKPKEIKGFRSFEVVEKRDNKELKLINRVDHLGNKSFFRVPATNAEIKDENSILAEGILKHDKRENKRVEGVNQNPVFAGQCCSSQMHLEVSSSFVKDATEISNKRKEYLEESHNTDQNFVDEMPSTIDMRCSMSEAVEKFLPDQVKQQNTTIMIESMEIDGIIRFKVNFTQKRTSTRKKKQN